MKLLLPLLLLLSAAAFADDHPDGCDMWSHLEWTGVISCDWYYGNGEMVYLCFNEYACVDNGCQLITQEERSAHGRTKDAPPIVSDRKRKQ